MTDKVNPTDETAIKMVERFIHYVLDLKAVHRTIKELFVSETDRHLMERTASSFFYDMNHIYVKHFLLESVKITDPEKTFGKENFSIDNILATIDWPDNVIDELNRIKPDIDNFTKHIKPARHKILAHYDKETFLANNILGSFPIGCDDRFVDALETMCNVLYKAVSNSVCGDICTGQSGDVLDLKNTLRKAIAFDRLFHETTGDDKLKLLNYLND